MAETLVTLSGIGVAYGRREILRDVGMRVERGGIVTIVGPNGGGKSTLLRIALGLIKPDCGVVERKSGIRLGYMPQKLHIERTLPLTVDRFLALAGRSVDAQARKEALERVRVAHLAKTSIHDVSGGEMQRVLLARAILRKPDLLVLDEPAAGVDVTGQGEFYELISRMRSEMGCGVLMVSHDLHLVMAATDQVLCLNTHVCCVGSPHTVSQDPNYLALFGDRAARNLAVYEHHHDHRHTHDGSVKPLPDHDHSQCNHG